MGTEYVVNLFRTEKEGSGNEILIPDWQMDAKTLKATGKIVGNCVYCGQEQNIQMGELKLKYDGCMDEHFLSWRCPKCREYHFIFLSWSGYNVAREIIQGLS